MKKHLVMIVGGYFPTPSPTGKCADQYISLVEDEFEIDVICLSKQNVEVYSHKGKRVHPVSCNYVSFQSKIEHKSRSLHLLSKMLLRMWNGIHQPNNLHWYVKKAYKKLKEIHSHHPIDVILSVGAPMAAHCAAKEFRKIDPKVRWIAYSVDSYSAQNKNRRRFCKFEKGVLSKADCNLLSEEIYNNSPFLYCNFSEKVKALPYLLSEMKSQEDSKCYFNAEQIHCVYAGRFYRDIRNPEFLLKAFVQTQTDAVLHLYCASDCDAMINEAVAASNGKIVRHEMVSLDEIVRVYAEADVLVSVGNSLPEFKPSKTFEHISTRKPILNIYYDGLKDDALANYPLALQICNLAEVESAAKEIDEFISAYAGVTVSEKDIQKEFEKYSPEAIRNILLSALKDNVCQSND